MSELDLRHEMAARQQAETERDRLNVELVHRDEDRIAALHSANLQMQLQLAERERAAAELARSNQLLEEAYDATLEGWARFLELRDKETQGHANRVTTLTVQLAVALGYPEEDLAHVRRGALLHDVGKMGIPDQILFKPGSLTEGEWAIMRLHPSYAYDLLRPITFLQPALEIPYCHHEKWDGSGYPRGLQGEGIPFSARIFAVVDVWDALRSDRPYRGSWSAAKVVEHIRENRGTHFDPQVVDLFVRILDELPMSSADA
jgi:HD-GYP domain-containing protein (c-di-GMP phosphodiesterase class II)